MPGRRLPAAAVLAVAALIKPPAVLALAAVWPAWDWRAPAVAAAGPVYLALALGTIGTLGLRVALHPDPSPEAVLTRLFWALFAFVFLLSPDYPWYWLILLPFVALLGPAPGWAATIACFVLYDVIDEGFEVGFALRDTALHLVILATLPGALRVRRAPSPIAAGGAAG